MTPAPKIKLSVDNSYLGQELTGFTEAYLMAIDCRMSSYIRFTVYLSSGAVWSGLPIEALYTDKFSPISKGTLTTEELQPYSCLEGPVSVIVYDLIKNCKLKTKLGEGHYMFTINYGGDGIAEDPEQYKTHNIVCLANGQLAALPNNYIRVEDNWFSNQGDELVFKYKRTNKHYFPGG